MTRPDPKSRRHRDAVVADWVRLNGPEFLDRETFDALKRTSVYEWATFGDAMEDCVAAVREAARADARRIRDALRALWGRKRR